MHTTFRPELIKAVPTNLGSQPHETVSIFLATDRDDINRILAEGLIAKRDNKKGTFLFHGGNTAFLGLDHTHTDNKGFSLGIRIADPDGDVINNLFQQDYEDAVAFEKERLEKWATVKKKIQTAKLRTAKGQLPPKPQGHTGVAGLAPVAGELPVTDRVEAAIDFTKFSDSYLKYYAIYGIGSDRRFWAGPFILQLTAASYTYDDAGVPVLQMSFMADIVVDVILKERTLSYFDTNSKHTPTALKTTRTKIGVSKNGDTVSITNETITKAITECHRKWAKMMGIDNFIHITPKIFLGLPTKTNGYAVDIDTKDLVKLIDRLTYLGFSVSHLSNKRFNELSDVLTHEEKEEALEYLPDYSQPQWNPPPSLVEGKEEEYKIFIDIDSHLKTSQDVKDPHEAFMQPYVHFYEQLELEHEATLDFKLYAESNTEILSLLKAYSPRYGYAIVKEDAPLYVLAETSIMQMEMYNNGVKVMVPALSPTEDEYKEEIKKYMANKIFKSRNMPSIYLQKAPNRHNTTNYQELEKGFDLPRNAFDLGALIGDSLLPFGMSDTEEHPMPVFEANTANANILSYSFDQSTQVLGALKYNVGEPLTGSWKRESVEDLIMYELTRLSGRDPGTLLLKDLGKEFELKQMARDLVDIIYGSSDATPREEGYIFSKDPKTSDPKVQERNLRSYLRFFWDTAIMGGTVGTIKTVPMFHLSDRLLFHQLCLLNIYQNPIKGGPPSTKTFYNTTYSGLYRLQGFRHVINAGEAYSEFYMIKNTLPLKKREDRKFDLLDRLDPNIWELQPPLPSEGDEPK